MHGSLSLTAIFLTVILDAAGIGLVLPVLPDLFIAIGAGEGALAYGPFLSLYAFMQFIFSPLLGSLSDRIGRKPVLIASAAGSALNYPAMALLPPLWVLFVARAIAGMTGASVAVASAYLTDVSEPERRAEMFGRLNACFGIGFILGPVLGGGLREFGLAWPFAMAAALTGLNLLLVLFVLPESRAAEASTSRFDPLAGFRDIGGFGAIAPLLAVFGLFTLIGEVGASVWVFYVEHKFGWQGLTVGASLTLFGLFHSLAQAFLIEPVRRRLGERGALMLGMAADGVAYVGVALAGDGRLLFVLIPLLCVGGISPSILQAVISRQASEDRQGQLQGVLSSLNSLAGMIGPTLFLAIYFATRDTFPGLAWIIGAALYLACLPLLVRRRSYAVA
jgi:DHA1 family tetracycline resistance protein-like MFS transporter